MHLTPQQLDEYRRDGVLQLGRVLEPSVVAEAIAHLEDLRRRNVMDSPTVEPDRKSYRLLNTCSHDPWFKTLVATPAILDYAESALGTGVQHFQDNIFYKPARDGSSTSWHQDNIWWKSNPPNMLTIWIALDDVDLSNGAVQYIRGSHSHLIDPKLPFKDVNGKTYSVLAPEQVDQGKTVSFTVPAGHAVMHHCLTIHGAPPNRSDRTRRAYTIHLAQPGILKLDPKASPILRGPGAKPA